MRTSWQVTCSVWHAMFMREALARITAARFAWMWMLVEPIAYVVIMIGVREVMGRVAFASGAEFVPWLITGIVSFNLFRDGVSRSMNAVEANRGLFAYRQVAPVDPVLVRAFLEGMLQTVVFAILIAGCALLGFQIIPADPLGVMFVWLGIWLLGAGGGLVVSSSVALVAEVGRVVRIIMLPLFMLSGAIVPLQMLPHGVQEALLYNPVLHGIESIRLCFFSQYKSLYGVNLLYLWFWALALAALGLALHVRYADRLKAQ